MTSVTPNNPPYPAYRSTDKETFAYDSIIRRWPSILQGIIQDVEENQLTCPEPGKGNLIIKAIHDILVEMETRATLRPIQDDQPSAKVWNDQLEKYFKGCNWENATWLFAECYLYRRLDEIFHAHWPGYDFFERQKVKTFKGSWRAVSDLSSRFENTPHHSIDQLIQICLWGNATDLSLLTNLKAEDLKRLQTVGGASLENRQALILVDDSPQLIQQLEGLRAGRVDFVLDNAGFEVFVDLVLADGLIQLGHVKKVVFHCKTIPWYVSDVLPKDIEMLIDQVLDPEFFPLADHKALKSLGERWRGYLKDGRFELRSDDFWCGGMSYWFLASEAPALFEELKKADLVIFKGDLNFRKLVFDCAWPVTTSFREAIGPAMAQEFTHLVSLRTNKADVMVGLTEEKKNEIESKANYEEWRLSGKYAVIEYN